MVPIENHGARATCKGTFVVQQISLLKLQTGILEVSFLNPHTHKPWVDPTHVGRCGLQKVVADSRG